MMVLYWFVFMTVVGIVGKAYYIHQEHKRQIDREELKRCAMKYSAGRPQ